MRLHILTLRPSREPANKIVVVTRGLALLRFDRLKNRLDAVDGGEDQRDGFGGDRHPVTEFTHQVLGGVRQRLEPGQPEKAAGSFDGMNEAKDVTEDLPVIGLLLETDEFGVDPLEAFIGLGQEFLK